MGKPLIVPTDSGRWVAIFGNGYNSVNFNPILFVVDVATGEVIRKIAPDDQTNESNGLGNVSVLDTNNNGLVDTVYGGDLQGNVWKFDIGGAATASWNVALSGEPLFVAMDRNGVRQPITGSFELAVGPGKGHMLYFGTGRYFVNGDNSASLGQQVQTLYGIWDNGTALSTGRTALVQQQIIGNSVTDPQLRSVTRNPVNYLASRGWYLDLVVGANNTGERFIATPRLQSGKVFFPAYQPGITADCAPGGTNWTYALNPLSGGAAFGKIIQPKNLPSDGNTGAVSSGGPAPNHSVGVIHPPKQLFCNPTDPNCDKYCSSDSETCGGEQSSPGGPGGLPPGCSEVIIAVAEIYRACGRQSWRQLL